MAGQWVERPDGRWVWDTSAPAADPNPTSILSGYAGGSPMSDQTPRSVYDPRLGNDGGGRYAEPDPIPAIDPDNPVTHVDDLDSADYGSGSDGPQYWTGSAPVARRSSLEAMYGTDSLPAEGREMSPGEYDQLRARQATFRSDVSGLTVCPSCGTGVHPDRLRD